MQYISLPKHLKEEIDQKISSLIKDPHLLKIFCNYSSWHTFKFWVQISDEIQIDFSYPEIFIHKNTELMIKFLEVLTPECLFGLLDISTACSRSESFKEWPHCVKDKQDRNVYDFLDYKICSKPQHEIWELTELGEAMKSTIMDIIKKLQINLDTLRLKYPWDDNYYKNYYTDLLSQLRQAHVLH